MPVTRVRDPQRWRVTLRPGLANEASEAVFVRQGLAERLGGVDSGGGNSEGSSDFNLNLRRMRRSRHEAVWLSTLCGLRCLVWSGRSPI